MLLLVKQWFIFALRGGAFFNQIVWVSTFDFFGDGDHFEKGLFSFFQVRLTSLEV